MEIFDLIHFCICFKWSRKLVVEKCTTRIWRSLKKQFDVKGGLIPEGILTLVPLPNYSPKGQLNSEWIYEVIVSPNKQTRIVALFWWFFGESRQFFWLWSMFVCLLGRKSLQFLVCILGETMTSQIHSEFNWPLSLLVGPWQYLADQLILF